EDAAAAHLGQSVSRRALERLFARLDRRGKGLLPALARKLAASDDLLSVASRDLLNARLLPAANAAREKAAVVCDMLSEWVRQQNEPVVRLTDAFDEEPIWRAGL